MSTRRTWVGLGLLAMGLGPVNVMHSASAQSLASLPDPTRPPPGLMPATALPPGTAPVAASAASAPPADTLAGLTLVRVDALTGKGMALIGGRMVSVGDRVGQAVVTAVDTQGVTLRTSRGTRRLSLWNPSHQASEAPSAVNDSEKETP
jgi:hypothetical protein